MSNRSGNGVNGYLFDYNNWSIERGNFNNCTLKMKIEEINQLLTLEEGVTIDISLGTVFQYRSNEEDLNFLCVTLPPWPGHSEGTYVRNGAWEPA